MSYRGSPGLRWRRLGSNSSASSTDHLGQGHARPAQRGKRARRPRALHGRALRARRQPAARMLQAAEQQRRRSRSHCWYRPDAATRVPPSSRTRSRMDSGKNPQVASSPTPRWRCCSVWGVVVHFAVPPVRKPTNYGHCGLFLPVFKTGRAGQPPAWKVRFLRRVVPLPSPVSQPSAGQTSAHAMASGASPSSR